MDLHGRDTMHGVEAVEPSDGHCCRERNHTVEHKEDTRSVPGSAHDEEVCEEVCEEARWLMHLDDHNVELLDTLTYLENSMEDNRRVDIHGVHHFVEDVRQCWDRLQREEGMELRLVVLAVM